MTKEEILSGNKLIAEFMEWHFSDTFEGLLPNHWVKENGEASTSYLRPELIFHSDWNWLMEVVEKIFNLYEWDDFIYNPKKCLFYLTTKIKIYAGSTDTDEGTCGEMIYKYIKSDKPLYDAVVEFIKWYNQQSK